MNSDVMAWLFAVAATVAIMALRDAFVVRGDVQRLRRELSKRKEEEAVIRADERTRSRTGLAYHDPQKAPMVPVPSISVPLSEIRKK
jgi:hypothetical protein